ncbi:hypothetical protein ACTD5D_00380 [Nocardia takedensis]|uniref:hypothetical protein n=1 Tax=Nocardia takedensis TaxID=259390 RepID=UPI003F764562
MCAAGVGPRPESTGDDAPVTVTRAVALGPIPQRIDADRYGNQQLMPCVKCGAPFDSRLPVPRDRLCAHCRPACPAQLTLFDVVEPPPPPRPPATGR